MNRFRIAIAVLAATLLLPFSALQAAGEYKVGSIEIDQPWARATPPTARAGAAYFTIHNTGTTEDRLIGISSPVAGQAEVHQITMSGDMMKMSEIKGGLAIPAGGSVTLAPNGYHVMLTGLKHTLREGSFMQITLSFANAGSIQIDVPVEAIGAPGPAGTKPGPAPSDNSMGGMKM